jgi:hypothetical protein
MTLSEFFAHKRILLFSPQFFGYGQEIANKLRMLGARVDYFDERPGNDFMTKAVIRVNKSLMSKKIDNYYRRIISKLDIDCYDYVLFLNAEAISAKNLQILRDNQTKAKFIIYMWDSLKNKKYTLDLLPYFDLKHTFDKEDSQIEKYGLLFRPLFFLDVYKDMGLTLENDMVDLLFVGTVHSDRYSLLMTIKEKCHGLGKNVDYFMFFQSKKLFYLQKALNKAFRAAKMSDFEFNPLTKDGLIQKINRGKVILDIQHAGQKGLTMRTIEMIGAKKKIITTNKEIMEYDFYNPNNIFYLDRDNIELKKSFFDNPYKEIDKEVYSKYSIGGWLQDVFSPSE